MTDDFRDATPGVRFKQATGKLYLFTKTSVSVVLAWPKPMAWKKSRRRPEWRHFRPNLRIPGGNLEETAFAEQQPLLTVSAWTPTPLPRAQCENMALHGFHETIPMAVRNLVAPFRSRHWHLLSFIARCGSEAASLVASNPALAYALASNWVFHRPPVARPLRSARALLAHGRKQREILEWLGFPGTEAARRMLAKIVPASASIQGLLYLRQAMSCRPAIRALSHLPRINASAIRIATDPRLLAAVTPGCLDEIAHDPANDRYPGLAHALKDCLEWQASLTPRPGFGRIRSLDALISLYVRYVDDQCKRAEAKSRAPFPPPPLPGTAGIVPLASARELEEESMQQRNCARTYAGMVIDGQVYLYRVFSPERCTLAMARKGRKWILKDLRADCNQKPLSATLDTVTAWLGSHQLQA